MELLDALKRRGSWETDLLKAVVDAWGQSDLAPGQWDEVLRFLLETDGVIPPVAHEASRLLENGISRSSNAIPDEYLPSAMQLSERLWSVCASSDDGKQETADDWLTLAINASRWESCGVRFARAVAAADTIGRPMERN